MSGLSLGTNSAARVAEDLGLAAAGAAAACWLFGPLYAALWFAGLWLVLCFVAAGFHVRARAAAAPTNETEENDG